MRTMLVTLILLSGYQISGRADTLATQPLSPSEADGWIHYLVPLPQRITLRAKVTIPSDQVAVTAAGHHMLIDQAVRELCEALGQSGTDRDAGSAAFAITLELGGTEAKPLAELPNSDQAYRIFTGNEGRALHLVARTPIGLYYAAKTLQQFIHAHTRNGTVAIPLTEITDWPDMAIRGVWGVDASSHVRWLSDRKYNYMEQIASSHINAQGRPVAALADYKQQMVKDGPSHGIAPVPAILHLEQIAHRGLFAHYPELKGRGEGIHEGAICYSNSIFTDILAEWIVGYLNMPGVNEVDVWMAENLSGKPGCQCERCRDQNRDLLELRAILAAWEKARTQKPDARLAILTSEETDRSNEQVLEVLPEDLRFWYYHSLLTYNTSETPMVPDYLARAAARGRDIGVCLNLSPHSTNYQPMTGVQFIHYRMTEFVDKKITGMLGYPTPRVFYYPVNTEAAAEWTWNADGRSPREFAFSWAVRAGKDDPELFAEWAMVHGEVAWDVYGSEFPAGEARKATGKLAEQLKTGKLPELGFVLWEIYPKPWGDIKTVEQLNRDVDLAGRAVGMARRLNDPALLHESLTVQGYIRSLKALYELKQIVHPEGVAEKHRAAAQQYFQAYLDALAQAGTNLVEWETSVADSDNPRHVRKVCDLLTRMIEEMAGTAEELGMNVQRP